jgi:hypothetical protein
VIIDANIGAGRRKSVITVYGASDDLIEVYGDIDEEFSPFSDYDNGERQDGAYLTFSNGTILRIEYDGIWRICPVLNATSVSIQQCAEDDEEEYSDKAVLDADIQWVALASSYARRSG